MMNTLKEIAKRIPGVPAIYQVLYNRLTAERYRGRTVDEVFTTIYETNAWGSDASVSGPGSDDVQTRVIVREIPRLFRDLEIRSILDIPCGDFNWMKNVDLDGIEYVGADIVEKLILENNLRFARENVSFHHLNLLSDSLPGADLVFCRDCLVHLSYNDIFSALENVCRGDFRYLLTTTFTDRRSNTDIATGQGRTLNLRREPFNLPEPIRVINEGCTEQHGVYADKSLGLWTLDSIRSALQIRR